MQLKLNLIISSLKQISYPALSMVISYISFVKFKKFLKANPSEIFYQVVLKLSLTTTFKYYSLLFRRDNFVYFLTGNTVVIQY